MYGNIRVTRARHAWLEEKDFCIDRPRGIKEHTFLRFHVSVELLVDGRVVTTEPGACIFYSADTPQWFHSPDKLIHDWVHLTGDMAGLLLQAGLRPDALYQPSNSRFITPIVREIELDVLTRRDTGDGLAELKLRELALKLSRAVRSSDGESAIKSAVKEQLRQVRGQVFASLDRSWTVEDMAALAYLSASRFYTVYRAVFGISPGEDLIQARIDMAKNRLRDSHEPISELAEHLGYRNTTHFCRQFKQITGLTPSQFRSTEE